MRGRFAPTPSGQLHIGNARTALLAWLHVRSAGGQFVLRMEDIDRPRSLPELVRPILEDLRWLGLDWDEGPDMGGPHGQYEQSQREDLYQQALERLESAGHLYPCYCSRAELMAIASAPHGLAEEGPIYPGTCRRLDSQALAAKRARGKAPSLRFTMPDGLTEFDDLAAGPQSYPSHGDFVVRRADGIFAYQLAVVVDDAAMGITHVLRGRDLLDSTPRQIRLFQALGLSVPQYSHVSLLFGPDGQRLSKRHGDVTIAGMRKAGTPPERIVGFLGYISGLIPAPAPVRPTDLVASFRLDAIPTEPVMLTAEELTRLSTPGPRAG